MLRKLILPLVAVVLLGGCMTGGYSYQRDRGDYYYGQPSTDYRYYGNAGYSDYRYRGYYPGYYGSAYYGNGYRYNNRYPYGYYRPPVVIVRPGHNNGDNNNHHPRPDNDRDSAPWRDYERLQRERVQRSERPAGTAAAVQRRPIAAPVRPTITRPTATRSPASSQSSSNRGSRMQGMIQKANKGRNASGRTQEK